MDEHVMPVQEPVKKARKKREGPRGTALHQLWNKKYEFLEPVPDEITRVFGRLTKNLRIMISGPSSHGKSRLTMLLLKILMPHGNTAYVSPEEGDRYTMQQSVFDNLKLDEHSGKIIFYDETMTYDELRKYCKKKKSARFVAIDSLQYIAMNKVQWQVLSRENPNKGFILVSHGGTHKVGPTDSNAKKIEFDVDIKVRVEGGVAFVRARGNGLKHYIIYEEGALKYWGASKLRKFKKG